MSFPARLLLIPVALLLVAFSFVHAASGTGMPTFHAGILAQSGIVSRGVGELVDRLFRAEMTALQSEALAEQGQNSVEALAPLAEDPMALRSFIEERQRSAGTATHSRFPRISRGLLRLARLSYAADPLNAATLRTIALGHVLHEDPARARRLMELTSRLSKRDSITNLWLAQDYGQRGNLEQMLQSFDYALRTSLNARRGAMSLVVGSLESFESHEVLGNLLQQHPDWEDAFWAEFTRNPVALANASAFFASSGIPLEQMPESVRPTFYANLERSGLYNVLFDLAALETPTGTGDLTSSASGFHHANRSNPLGWTFHSRGAFSTSLNPESGELHIDASAGAYGLAADRLMPGRRDFGMSLRMAQSVPLSARVTLSAACVETGKRELAKVVLSPGQKEGAVVVRARECDFLSLELSFAVEQGRRNPTIRVASIEFEEL